MTERLADVTARIDSVRQLDSVVNAMTGIAAARARTARAQIDAVNLYAASISAAMSRILTQARTERPGEGGLVRLVFCAEQGFAGAYSERVLDSLARDTVVSDVGEGELFLIGTRAMAIASQRGLTPKWAAPLPPASIALPKFADHLLRTLYPEFDAGRINRLEAVFTVWHAGAAKIKRRQLWPLDFDHLPPMSGQKPLTNLDEEALITSLGADYLHAQICKVALHAFAAENEARMAAMAAARAQIERELAEDEAIERRVRQEATTAEIIELATGELASHRHT